MQISHNVSYRNREMNSQNLKKNNEIVIYGDLMLDKYYQGSVSRISPEAPVPVVKINNISTTLGGAGNVAHNVATLESCPTLIGLIGKDDHAKDLRKIAADVNMTLQAIETDAATIAKIRIIGGHQQITRLDFEDSFQINSELLNSIKKTIDSLKETKIIVISDYGKGACTPEICQYIINSAKKRNIQVMIDPKGSDWIKYNGAFIITPNLNEVKQILNIDIQNTNSAIEAAGKDLMDKYKIENLLITRSEKGMTLITQETTVHYHTKAKEVYDVSGAGDTVIATIAWSLCNGQKLKEAVYMANMAAGIVVSKLGTTPIKKKELMTLLEPYSHKYLDREVLIDRLELEKSKGNKIVFTNGCFDILHRGHVDYLQSAKKLGDLIVIGVNTDRSVRKLKGPSRPINEEKDRIEILSHLEFVDYVTLFDEETPYELIKSIKPDILVKGGDYKINEVVGREFAAEIRIIPLTEGYSTTKIIEKAGK